MAHKRGWEPPKGDVAPWKDWKQTSWSGSAWDQPSRKPKQEHKQRKVAKKAKQEKPVVLSEANDIEITKDAFAKLTEWPRCQHAMLVQVL